MEARTGLPVANPGTLAWKLPVASFKLERKRRGEPHRSPHNKSLVCPGIYYCFRGSV